MKRVLLLIAAFCLLCGFRKVSPEQIARDVIQRTESHFNVTEHAELYKYVRMDSKGVVAQGEMLIIFRYGKDEAHGIFRLLPDDDNEGVTLISRQSPNQLPELSHYDDNTDSGGRIGTAQMHTKLGDTDWFFEGIYDDDKMDWIYEKTGSGKYRGHQVQIIEGRYRDPLLQHASGYSYRRILIRPDNDLPVASEFYNDRDEIVYTIDLLHREHFEFDNDPHVRTRQFQIINFREGSTTVMTRIASNWAPNLPPELYNLEFADDWDEETDKMIKNQLMPLN
ncbi:MAG: outer membrane lipoprotein-sorting protein [Verrucomicrobiota bacterium]